MCTPGPASRKCRTYIFREHYIGNRPALPILKRRSSGPRGSLGGGRGVGTESEVGVFLALLAPKSPQTRIVPSRLTTGTMGAAHSKKSTCSMIPSFSSLPSDSSTLERSACGIDRGRQNRGLAVRSTWSFAVVPVMVPRPGANRFLCASRTFSSVVCWWCSLWITLQFSLILASQSRPSRLGPLPFTTRRLRSSSCWS